jgi:poly [ADP-ribose] polymerase 10/14/15
VQKLTTVVTKCLTEANSRGFKSLVFPALGTGNLKYPQEETATVMLQAIDCFQLDNPSTSLKDIKIVIHKQDSKTLQVKIYLGTVMGILNKQITQKQV